MIRIPVTEEPDVCVARLRARELAAAQGFPEARALAVATAVSEVARNIVAHAGAGEVVIEPVTEEGRAGLVVVARDEAPGIADVEAVMRDGYSTAGGLGLGLSSAKRLMDEFVLASAPGRGTTIVMKKWAHERDR